MAKKSRTREARQRRQRQQRQNRQRMILIGIVIVVILVVALIVVSNQPVEAFVPADLEARYEGVETSYSAEGYPRIGDPDAPVTLEEYASFSCPGCQAFHDASFDALIDRVQTGQVLLTYVPLQTGSIPNAEGAARAALCAGQQGMFWEMHDLLFEWHTRYGNTAFSQNRLLAGVDELGLNGDSFTSCFNSQPITRTLTAAENEGVASTPTIDVNGVSVETAESGGIPTTEEVLAAIDSATPNDWTPGGTDEETEAVVEETPEVTDEPTMESEDVVEPEVEATDEPESEADMMPDESGDENEDEVAEETPEATDEAED